MKKPKEISDIDNKIYYEMVKLVPLNIPDEFYELNSAMYSDEEFFDFITLMELELEITNIPKEIEDFDIEF